MSRKHHTLEVGQRFNRLVVVSGPVAAAYSCRCDCGSVCEVLGKRLASGHTKSCGCYRTEKTSARATVRNHVHGHSVRGEASPEYHVWHGIQQRCHTESNKDYPRYGGRGIFVCARWRESFAAFYEDMGPRPSARHSIERNENDGPYSPENTRWATAKEQAENRRSNVILEYDGKRMTQMEWSRVTGIGVTTIGYRLSAGWPIDRILTQRANYRKKAN